MCEEKESSSVNVFETRPELAALSLIKGGRSDGRGGGVRQTQRRSKGEEEDDGGGMTRRQEGNGESE